MARVLTDDAIPADAGIAIEYHIPLSAKRLDMLITGHAADDRRSAVIVELKQWDHAQLTPKDAIVRTYLGGSVREAVHPSYQAWSYAELMKSLTPRCTKATSASGPAPTCTITCATARLTRITTTATRRWRRCSSKAKANARDCGTSFATISIAAMDCASSPRSKRARSVSRRSSPTASLAC